MQEAYIGFIGQGYYDIYYFCGEDLCVYRIDEMLRIILDDAKVRFEFDDEVWEYICEHLDDDMY
ncbi:hypothetical protein [Clostridium cochlearium]|uniref:hypothetical protein n=1 Tax=Clostridium cochlearium TaxID=1494 RepID=UPI00241FE9DF|nr:hypothetical protein [Clostridium cochlearium]MBE6065008.1 hypothetical protein [Clostridium cochlearium]